MSVAAVIISNLNNSPVDYLKGKGRFLRQIELGIVAPAEKECVPSALPISFSFIIVSARKESCIIPIFPNSSFTTGWDRYRV